MATRIVGERSVHVCHHTVPPRTNYGSDLLWDDGGHRTSKEHTEDDKQISMLFFGPYIGRQGAWAPRPCQTDVDNTANEIRSTDSPQSV